MRDRRSVKRNASWITDHASRFTHHSLFFLKRFYSESPCSGTRGQGLTEASPAATVSISEQLNLGNPIAAVSEAIQKGDISLMGDYEVLVIIVPNIEESGIDTLVHQL